MGQIFVIIAGIIHIYIFVMESVLWGRQKINRIFALSSDQAEQNRVFAFNQGYYNLFLAIAAVSGVWFHLENNKIIGMTLMIYACLSMLGASLVLVFSQRKLIRAALIQGGPPLIAIIFLMFR